MIDIIEVKTKKDKKEFIDFPLRLYKNCAYFVPLLYGDEKKLLNDSNENSIAESVFYLAKQNGRTVGRIQGILHKQYNELNNDKRIRFTRFDSIDDVNVSRALFNALENWGTERGMEKICGPLGYNDLEREGLLIDGFTENSTYEEQYNYAYYPKLLEDAGYSKEVDWLEFELSAPKEKNVLLDKVASRVLDMNKLHIADTNMSKKAFIEKYADSFFDCFDICYGNLYGAMPIPQEQRKELISQFQAVLNIKYVVFICNDKDEVVAFGLSFPNIGEALKKSGGRLTLPAIIKLLKTVKAPKVLDLGLVAVRPEYQNAGVNSVLIKGMIDMLVAGKIEKCETNLNLETNVQVMSQWKYFTSRQHKRRRAYLKTIEMENNNA